MIALKQGRMRAELRLTTRTARKDDHCPSDSQHNLWTDIFFEKRQCKINACSDASRSVDMTVPNEELTGVNFERWVGGRQ